MKVTNILLWVHENKLAEKFYKKLGFEIVASDDEHSRVRLGDFEVVLITMRDESEFVADAMVSNRGKGVYIYIKVDDVDGKYTELIDRGFEPATKPRDWQWGNREFILKDSDGYKLCFWQPLDNR